MIDCMYLVRLLYVTKCLHCPQLLKKRHTYFLSPPYHQFPLQIIWGEVRQVRLFIQQNGLCDEGKE